MKTLANWTNSFQLWTLCPYPVSVPENIILETNSSLIGYNEKLLKTADNVGLSNNDTWLAFHSLSEKWSISDSIWYDNPVPELAMATSQQLINMATGV